MSSCFSFWLPRPPLITWSSSSFSSSLGFSSVLVHSQTHSFGLTHGLRRQPLITSRVCFWTPPKALPAGLGKGAQDANKSSVFAELKKRMSSWETGDGFLLLLHVHESYLNTNFSSCGLLRTPEIFSALLWLGLTPYLGEPHFLSCPLTLTNLHYSPLTSFQKKISILECD